MFSGIIKNTGKILKIYKRDNNCTIKILSKIKFKKNEIGSSISCSGTCLTLENYKSNICKFYISKESLNRTIFKFATNGDIINLEKSLKFGKRISGHFVQGHVDCTSKIKKIKSVGKSWIMHFLLSNKYRKNIVEKGSIAVNGISLTISKILKDGFLIVIIPQTLKSTNLKNLKEKDEVNIEFDILGKYIKKFLK